LILLHWQDYFICLRKCVLKSGLKVSTYLVAFANGPFEYLESSYKSPLSGKIRPLRIYGKFDISSDEMVIYLQIATKDLIHQAHFGLDIKARVLPVYEKVFDIEFPLPKLDTLVVGIRNSFLGVLNNIRCT